MGLGAPYASKVAIVDLSMCPVFLWNAIRDTLSPRKKVLISKSLVLNSYLVLCLRAAFGPIVGLPKTCSHFFRFQPIAAREVIAVIVRLAIAVISSVALRIDHSIVSMKPIGAIMRVPLERRTV